MNIECQSKTYTLSANCNIFSIVEIHCLKFASTSHIVTYLPIVMQVSYFLQVRFFFVHTNTGVVQKFPY